MKRKIITYILLLTMLISMFATTIPTKVVYATEEDTIVSDLQASTELNDNNIEMNTENGIEEKGTAGIRNNGLAGISINIYSSIYKDSRWGTYGDPYGSGGCTWFVGARVMELTGKGGYNTQVGRTWVNSYGPSLGFSTGSSPQAPAVICWSGHVAILERIDGNTAYISEGGNTSYPGNDYCVIRSVNVSNLQSLNSGFLGYVYLGNTTPPAPTTPITFADQNINGTSDTNAEVYVKVMNPNRQSVTRVGCYLYDENNNLLKSYYENCNYTTSYVNYNCNVNNDMGYTLKPGTTYKYVLCAIANGTEYKDSVRTFKTTGSSDTTSPVISDIIVETGTDGNVNYWKIKCKASDNVGVVRVQFPTWTVANGQDDIQQGWDTNPKASGTKKGDYYEYTVYPSEHNNEYGLYRTHIYAYDAAGNRTYVTVPDINYDKNNPFTYPDFSLNKQKIILNKTKQLNCGFTATWTSSNPDIATIDSSTGLLTGVSEGKTTITATANNVKWEREFQVVQDCEILFSDSTNGKDARVMGISVYPHNYSQYVKYIKFITETEQDSTIYKKEKIFKYNKILDKGTCEELNLIIDRSDFNNANGVYKTTCEIIGVDNELISSNNVEYSFADYSDNIYLKMEIGQEQEITETDIPNISTSQLQQYTSTETDGVVSINKSGKTYIITPKKTGRTYLLSTSSNQKALIIVDIEDKNCTHENIVSDFTWSTDYSTCNYVLKCKDCNSIIDKGTCITTQEVTNATCTKDGTIEYKASVTYNNVTYNADSYTETTPALGHDYVEVAAVEATYRADGHTTSNVCSRCGDTKEEGTVIPALSFTVNYNGNGSTTGKMESQTDLKYTVGGNLEKINYQKTGFLFNGWNSKADGSGTAYADKTDICDLIDLVEENNGTVTLYAQWKPISYTIHFDKNTAKSGSMKRVYPKYGRNYRLPACGFKKPGYAFAGWNTRKDGKGTTYKNQSNVKNLTTTNGKVVVLYAQWRKVSVSTPGKPTLNNYSAGRLTITCKAVKGAKGYLIQYSTNKNMRNAKTMNSTALKRNIYNLKKGTTYYVRVRAYKVDSTGKKVCGKYSAIQVKKLTK